MGRPPEEAEVRRIREQRWSQWETFRFDNEGRPDSGMAEVDKSAEIHALCDSWLAQARVIEAQREALREIAEDDRHSRAWVEEMARIALAAGGETET